MIEGESVRGFCFLSVILAMLIILSWLTLSVSFLSSTFMCLKELRNSGGTTQILKSIKGRRSLSNQTQLITFTSNTGATTLNLSSVYLLRRIIFLDLLRLSYYYHPNYLFRDFKHISWVIHLLHTSVRSQPTQV